MERTTLCRKLRLRFQFRQDEGPSRDSLDIPHRLFKAKLEACYCLVSVNGGDAGRRNMGTNRLFFRVASTERQFYRCRCVDNLASTDLGRDGFMNAILVRLSKLRYSLILRVSLDA
jgi:hypothetical protein